MEEEMEILDNKNIKSLGWRRFALFVVPLLLVLCVFEIGSVAWAVDYPGYEEGNFSGDSSGVEAYTQFNLKAIEEPTPPEPTPTPVPDPSPGTQTGDVSAVLALILLLVVIAVLIYFLVRTIREFRGICGNKREKDEDTDTLKDKVRGLKATVDIYKNPKLKKELIERKNAGEEEFVEDVAAERSLGDTGASAPAPEDKKE